jgi:ABC-type nitrate/sulfonate/bicarbonate transport system substrate-binding protein
LLSLVFSVHEVPAQTTNVRIAFNGFGGVAPLYLGDDAAIFKKQGLNLELVFIPGGSLSLQALIGKSLDLLLTGGPPVLNAYLQGAKIKIIGGLSICSRMCSS